MSIESLYADRIEEAIQRQLRNPGPAPAPASFNLWSMLAAGGKAPVSGGLESAGSLSDLLSGFGTALAASGGSGGGMFSVPSAEEAKQEKEARDRMLKGDAFDTAPGNELRRRADEFAPDPVTSHKADQVMHGLVRGVSKAVADVGLMGPVAGPIAFGLDEGNTAAQRLRSEGVDTNTAATVGTVTGIVQAVGAGVPGVGPTVKTTLGLAAIAGPASFVTQEAAARRVLQRSNYPELAAQHDPLDPLGWALSIGVPGFAAGLHIRGLKKPTELADVVKHIESGGNRFDENGNLLTSPKGAQGEMQVMPKTATDPGFGVVPAKDNSPAELARVGRDYLVAMQQKYGDTDKALAAYNAGPGAVDNAIKAHGDDWLAHLPDETQKYVAKANKLMGDHIADKGAADPAVIDAARVKVLDEVLARGLPDHPEAHAELMRAVDDVAAGRMPVVPERIPDTQLPAFKEWFGGSKVVDEQGAPLVMYHGTREDVEAFDIHNYSGTNFGDKSEGFAFFTNKPNKYPDSASDYTEPGMPGGNVVPVYVALKNPLVYKADGEYSAVFAFDKNVRAIREQMKAGGHDGVIVKYTDGSSDEVVVAATRAEQIKSAIGNSGKFDRNSPSLTDPLRPGEANPRETTSTLPPADRPTIEPETVATKTTGEPGAVDQARLKALLEEQPHLEDAILRAHEAYDEEVHLADLVKVAVECALTNGG